MFHFFRRKWLEEWTGAWQRVNTVGGKAPAEPGDFEGEVVRVPYTAEYFFYRAHR